jgi:hypothetical protein
VLRMRHIRVPNLWLTKTLDNGPLLVWEIGMIWDKNIWNDLEGLYCGPDSSVGIATGYGLDGPGIETRWG